MRFKTFPSILILLFIYSNAKATLVIPPANMEAMIQQSEYIVYGTVISHVDEYGSINSFRIEKSLRGSLLAHEIILLKEENLRTEYAMIEVNGNVDFKLGAKYLLFLFKDGSGFYRPRLLSMSVYEQINIAGVDQFLHTQSITDMCYMQTPDHSLIGGYETLKFLNSFSSLSHNWSLENAGFTGEIQAHKDVSNHENSYKKKSINCTRPSHCVALIGNELNLNTTCNLGNNLSPAKHENTSFVVKIASDSSSDSYVPNYLTNLSTAIAELNNLNGLSFSQATPLVQNCSTATQASVAEVVRFECNQFGNNEIWIFFEDPFDELGDFVAPCNGIIGKGGAWAYTPCHIDQCGDQWLSARQPYFYLNENLGCLGDYNYTASIIHEILHSMNLDHIEGTCTAIMNPGICLSNSPNVPNYGIKQLDLDCIEWMYNQCPSNAIIENVTYQSNSSESITVQNEISAENVLVQANADVEYDAGTLVELLPTFEVRSGALFHAFISGCGI